MESMLKFVHVVAMAVWVGGMFFAHFCLRPAAFEVLAPPQRLPLMVGALGRFFRWLLPVIGLLWLSGLWRLGQVGFAAAPPSWHTMAALGALMTVIFAVIAHGLFPRVRRAVGDQKFPEAAAGLGRIRTLVAVNLGLGLVTIGVATLGR
jgi:uncharacterized membrane protein